MFFLQPVIGSDMDDMTVCLTFDDGPGGHTFGIADYLQQQGIPASFFFTGRSVEQVSADVLRRLVDQGHLVGNHTQNHAGWHNQPVDEVAAAHRAIEPYTTSGKLGKLAFRAPYGLWNRPLAEALNGNDELRRTYFGPVGWDIDARDWEFWRKAAGVNDGDALERCIARHLELITARRRGIVLMHSDSLDEDARPKNQANLLVERIVPRLQELGYRFVRLDDIRQIQAAAGVTQRFTIRHDIDRERRLLGRF
jgi:peptidoglycan/xylan/chitin deacetylase (PgdA/CDA1 family)